MRFTHILLTLGFAATCLDRAPAKPLATSLAAAQEEPAEKKKGDERLEAWPKVDKADVDLEIERLRKARTPEMEDGAHEALVKIGAGAAPQLLAKFGREKDAGAQGRLEAILELVTDARHTRLLAPYFEDKSNVVRVWALRRVAGFPDEGVKEAAEKAHAAAKKRKRDKDPEEILAAALCCASSGSFDGFEELTKAAEENWKKEGQSIGIALAPLRGLEATDRVRGLLEGKKRQTQVTGLRLLAACGEAEAAKKLVRPFLDSTDNSLRIGAINALRGIVDGDPPLAKLSVFQAIEEANKWKARL